MRSRLGGMENPWSSSQPQPQPQTPKPLLGRHKNGDHLWPNSVQAILLEYMVVLILVLGARAGWAQLPPFAGRLDRIKIVCKTQRDDQKWTKFMACKFMAKTVTSSFGSSKFQLSSAPWRHQEVQGSLARKPLQISDFLFKIQKPTQPNQPWKHMVLQQVLGELGLSAASQGIHFESRKKSGKLSHGIGHESFFFKNQYYLKDQKMIEVGSKISWQKPRGLRGARVSVAGRPAHFVSGLGLGRRSFQTATLLSAGRGS